MYFSRYRKEFSLPFKREKLYSRLFFDTGGFTLVEILITMAVMAMLVPAVMGLFIAGNSNMATGREEAVAVKLAHIKIEAIKDSGFSYIEENHLFSDELIEDYGDIEGFEEYKTVTSAKKTDIIIPGELLPLKMYEVSVSVYRKDTQVIEDDLDYMEKLCLSHKILLGF